MAAKEQRDVVTTLAVPPNAWGGAILSQAQIGAAKNGDTLGVVGAAPGGMYVQRNMQLLQLVTGCEQKNTLYCYNWTPPSAGADVERPEATADFGDTVLRMREECECAVR